MADDILPPEAGAAIDKLLEAEDKGPLKPLAEAEAEDAEGTDETTRIEAAAETEGDPEVEDDDEKPEPEEAPGDVLEQIAAVLKQIDEADAAAAKKEPVKSAEPEAAPVPADIQALLDHDDPGVSDAAKALYERHKKLDERLARVEGAIDEQVANEQSAVFDTAVDAVAKMCNPPLTSVEAEWLVDRLTEQKNGTEPMVRSLVASASKVAKTQDQIASLTVAAGVQKLLPGRLKATNGKTGTAPKGAEGSRPVVHVQGQRPEKGTIDDRGGSAGPKPTPEVPPANETLEAAIARGGKALRW